MILRRALLAVALCAAVAGGVVLGRRGPDLFRLGRAAARNVSDDIEALFI